MAIDLDIDSIAYDMYNLLLLVYILYATLEPHNFVC